MPNRQFDEDIDLMLQKLAGHEGEHTKHKLEMVREKLVSLYRRNLVKINHSIAELVCAKELIVRGYDVDVEHPVNNTLVCDIFSVKGDGNMIIEIETGFIPPEHALDPITYGIARIASKIARYSNYANKFSLGTPPSNILQIPELFIKPPLYRKDEEATMVKNLCDRYYANPPISINEIKQARLHSIYIINVDEGRIEEIDPESYIKNLSWLQTIGYL